jgi:hypothetical protein
MHDTRPTLLTLSAGDCVWYWVQAQDAKVKGMSSELSRLEDRVRSESAQQAELQVSNAYLANAGM